MSSQEGPRSRYLPNPACSIRYILQSCTWLCTPLPTAYARRYYIVGFQRADGVGSYARVAPAPVNEAERSCGGAGAGDQRLCGSDAGDLGGAARSRGAGAVAAGAVGGGLQEAALVLAGPAAGLAGRRGHAAAPAGRQHVLAALFLRHRLDAGPCLRLRCAPCSLGPPQSGERLLHLR